MDAYIRTIIPLLIATLVAVVTPSYAAAKTAFGPITRRNVEHSTPAPKLLRAKARGSKSYLKMNSGKATTKQARKTRVSASRGVRRLGPRWQITRRAKAGRSAESVSVAGWNNLIAAVCVLPSAERARRIGRSLEAALSEEAENASLVSETAARLGVPTTLALAVAYHESRLDECAKSHTGVWGVMQVTKLTAQTYRLNRDITEENVEAGVRVLRRAIRACGKRDYACLASRYNGSTQSERARWASSVRVAHMELRYQVGDHIQSLETGTPGLPTKFVRLATAGSLI
jgi:soluble lytic murein transglycosylase-like protein